MLSSLPPKRAFEMVQKGEARLVDVRESSEYAEKFIPGSRLIPLSAIATQNVNDSEAKDKPVIFFLSLRQSYDKFLGSSGARCG